MKLFLRIIAIPVLVALLALGLLNLQLHDLSTKTVDIVSAYYNTFTRSAIVKHNSPPQDSHFLYASEMSVSRVIRKVFLAREQAEGAGARVRRSIGTPQLRNFSPFLMLDHFSIKPGAGFPDQYVNPEDPNALRESTDS